MPDDRPTGGSSEGSRPDQIAALIARWQDGDVAAVDDLATILYDDLRTLAEQVFWRHPRKTLQPTALVHELYLLLLKQRKAPVDEQHLLKLSGFLMWRFLRNYVRSRENKPEQFLVTLDVEHLRGGVESVSIDALVDAVEALAAVRPRAARVFQMRYLTDMPTLDIAEEEDIDVRTVRRDLTLAKAFVRRELGGGG